MIKLANPVHEPDYSGAGIANLMASVTAAIGHADDHTSLAPCSALSVTQLAAARHVVLLVIDGLGSAQLAQHAPHGCMAAARVAELTSVFPSTTASAVSTFLTGDAPITHGVTGWHMWFRELGVVGAPLPFRIRGSDVGLERMGLSARALLQPRPLAGRLARRSVLVHPEHLCGTPFTSAHCGGAQVRPYRTLAELVEEICVLGAETEPSYCYAYWPQLDTLSHVYGAHGEKAAGHLRELDAAVEQCADRLRRTGTVLLVSADHGFVDTRKESRLDLADFPDLARTLSMPLCGEPRMAYCYVRAGAQAEFEAIARERLGHAAEIFRAEQVLASGWLGPGEPHARLHERLGTHVLAMKDDYCLTDRVAGETRAFDQVGVHGGLSDAELRVPLMCYPG